MLRLMKCCIPSRRKKISKDDFTSLLDSNTYDLRQKKWMDIALKWVLKRCEKPGMPLVLEASIPEGTLSKFDVQSNRPLKEQGGCLYDTKVHPQHFFHKDGSLRSQNDLKKKHFR